MNGIFETRSVKVAEAGEHYASIKIGGSDDAIDAVDRVLGPYFDTLDCEEFHIFALNTKNKIIKAFKITRGTLDASLVHPREVFKAAISVNASSIILIHNHPSGDSTPSPNDYAVTTRLKEAGDILGIDVLDHIVYGDVSTSIASAGWSA